MLEWSPTLHAERRGAKNGARMVLLWLRMSIPPRPGTATLARLSSLPGLGNDQGHIVGLFARTKPLNVVNDRRK
jgi:hypothetical protein